MASFSRSLAPRPVLVRQHRSNSAPIPVLAQVLAHVGTVPTPVLAQVLEHLKAGKRANVGTGALACMLARAEFEGLLRDLTSDLRSKLVLEP